MNRTEQVERLAECRRRIYEERAKRNNPVSLARSSFLSEKAHLAMRVAMLLARYGRYLCDFADEGDAENGPKLTGSCWLQAGGCIALIEFLSYPDFYNVVWVSCSSRRALRSRGEHAFWPTNEPDFGFHFDGKVCLRLPDLIGKNMVNVLHAPSHSLKLQA